MTDLARPRVGAHTETTGAYLFQGKQAGQGLDRKLEGLGFQDLKNTQRWSKALGLGGPGPGGRMNAPLGSAPFWVMLHDVFGVKPAVKNCRWVGHWVRSVS